MSHPAWQSLLISRISEFLLLHNERQRGYAALPLKVDNTRFEVRGRDFRF
jgi:hypothetical protein